jgi:hypothetical protein
MERCPQLSSLVILNLNALESAATMLDFTEFRPRHHELKHLRSLPHYPGSQVRNDTSNKCSERRVYSLDRGSGFILGRNDPLG